MTYTVLSAKYANSEHTAAVIKTVEAGDVLISERDTPALWTLLENAASFAPAFSLASAMERLRSFRSPILNALAGIGFDALAADDQVTIEAVKVARQGLKDIPLLPSVLGATSDEEFDAAVMYRYKQLAAAAPANVRTAFKDLA